MYSTETAFLQVYCEWCDALDQGEIVLVASLNVFVAFYTVSHKVLLDRLLQAGISGRAKVLRNKFPPWSPRGFSNGATTFQYLYFGLG
jgi:hypothetical protein